MQYTVDSRTLEDTRVLVPVLDLVCAYAPDFSTAARLPTVWMGWSVVVTTSHLHFLAHFRSVLFCLFFSSSSPQYKSKPATIRVPHPGSQRRNVELGSRRARKLRHLCAAQSCVTDGQDLASSAIGGRLRCRNKFQFGSAGHTTSVQFSSPPFYHALILGEDNLCTRHHDHKFRVRSDASIASLCVGLW